MATLSEIRNNVLAKLDDGDVQRPTSSQVNAQINSTIDYYENKAFWFTQGLVTLQTVAQNKFLSLAAVTDFKMLLQPNSLVIIDGEVRYPLTHLTPLAIDTINTNAQGRPWWYTYRNGQIELYYIPDRVYDVEFFYRKSYTDLTADTATNDFTVNAPRLIEYRTLADLLLDYREDTERGNIYLTRAADELKTIQTETYNRTSTGNLSTENIIDGDRDRYWNYWCN